MTLIVQFFTEADMPRTQFIDILRAVKEDMTIMERKCGIKYGHTVECWLLMIQQKLDDAKIAAIEGDAIMPLIVNVAALCFAAAEEHGIDYALKKVWPTDVNYDDAAP